MMNWVTLLLLVWGFSALQSGFADLVRVDLSSQKAWRLTSSNNSIDLPTTVPAHTLSVLASAGVVAQDVLYRYGERDTRWVGEERWNFTLLWSSKKHQLLTGCRHVLLVLHGIDTFGTVVLNGRHVLQADNAHRSWWLPLSSPDVLREGANMLSVVLQPAAATAARAQAAYPYAVPTMPVPGGIPPYNFARKPAFDFGWDWGPAFVPVGVSGPVELVGFDRATLIGAHVTQDFNSSSKAFELTITAQFVVPAEGDTGTLSVTLAVLDVHKEQQVHVMPGVVGGNQLQTLVKMKLQLPASKVQLWQPLTLAPKGQKRQLYDLAVMFEPAVEPPTTLAGTCGVTSGKHHAAPEPEIRSTIVRRIGFCTVELIQQPVQAAAQELLGQQGGVGTQVAPHPQHTLHHEQQRPQLPQDSQDSSRAQGTTAAEGPQGESFYFKVNGVPVFAKGANLIPLHVLSTAVTTGTVKALLQSAVDANMNMIRIWGGGLYQVDELYEAADELGLMVWQEAMFACSPYPRNAAFLANVEAELTQQLLRLGSHASLVVFGGNNEVEQSLEWYTETRDNIPMYTTDYTTLFVDTIGQLVQKMLPSTPWVDSSPSRGAILLPDAPGRQAPSPAPGTGMEAAAAAPEDAGDPAGAAAQAAQAPDVNTGVGSSVSGTSAGDGQEQLQAHVGGMKGAAVKRWGNTNDPTVGDVHFYNYRDDCQDWQTYPRARFVSEYGWQSYPSWSTYAAATAQEDWQLTADMTDYRQRHPNGTVELLAQLQRRFKLPQAWLDLLHQQQAPHRTTQHQEPKQHNLESQPAAQATANSLVSRVWLSVLFHARLVMAVLLHRLGVPLLPGSSTEHAGADTSSTGSPAAGLVIGKWAPTADGDAADSTGSSRSQYTDMQHFIYLTQLQQMLCYETALQHWRRLRSDTHTLSMGVLYWQLNDVWAGASWSSIDYGGVWKPVQYGVARAFADVALNVQHDLQGDAIQVYVANDMQQAVQVQLSVRLLSVTDTAAHCHDTGSRQPPHSSSPAGGTHTAFAAAPYVKQHHMLKAEAPAAGVSLLWSTSVAELLKKAGSSCSRSSCYVHITLADQQQQHVQEATLWLAPFKDLPLQDPRLAVTAVSPEHQSGSVGARLSAEYGAEDDVTWFKVSSQAVAVYAVWETEAGHPVGHFTSNALTVHPCEPYVVGFVPRGESHKFWNKHKAAADASLTKQGTTQSSGQLADGSGSHAGQAAGVVADSSRPTTAQSKLLQEQVSVSSLWDHQVFDQPARQSGGIAAV